MEDEFLAKQSVHNAWSVGRVERGAAPYPRFYFVRNEEAEGSNPFSSTIVSSPCAPPDLYPTVSKNSDHFQLVSMRVECLPGFKQRLQAGKNTWPSIGAGRVSGIILGPLVVRHRYFGGFGLGDQFDSRA
jgi:hypothetical protein